MRIVKILAGIAMGAGFLLMVGAVGNGDFYGYMTVSDYVHIAVGFVLFVGACPVMKKASEEE